MAKFAEKTKVSAEKSRAEIETILRRYGAEDFGYYSRKDAAFITFVAKARKVLFRLPLPDRTEKRFTHWKQYGTLKLRTADSAYREWDQVCRQRWRALALAIKAKLESVESDITTFEEEFMAHIVLPDGSTVGNWLAPHLDVAYKLGRMPQPALPPADEYTIEGEVQ